jgi:hypothetical protein
MTFQTVIDNAESISFNRKKKVAQSVSREGIVRSVSLGGQVWEFEVTLPDGPSWQRYRPLIEKIEALDRVTTSTIQINLPGHSWLSGYQGNLNTANQQNITVTLSTTSNTTLIITGGGTGLIAGQFRFRSGDLIQLGTTGKVYSVVDDVLHNGTSIIVHRPIREAAGTYTLTIGQAVTWTVLCTRLPQWTIFARDQISWDGPFVFSEVL